MAIPTQIGGYERQPSGMFIKLADGTGPYSVDSSGTATLIGAGGGGGPAPEVTGLQFNDAANSMYLALRSIGV